MEYYELKLCKVYINDDPELTLTYFTKMSNLVKLVSSPEPKAHRRVIGYPWSGVRQSSVRPYTISNIFFSETAWPIKAKFYVEPPWERGTKAYINGPVYITKMAAMPIFGTNL